MTQPKAKPKALITGAQGFIGKHLVAHFGQTHDIVTLGLNSANDIVCDLGATVPTLPDMRFDIVVHAAGVCTDANADRVNRQGTEHLLQALGNLPPTTLVYLSSCSVYGHSGGTLIKENHPTEPQSAYGESKLQAERLIGQWCADKGVQCVVLRPATVIGQGMHGSPMQLAQAIHSGSYLHIPGCNAELSFVHVTDVARLALMLADHPGTYNLTDGTPHRLQEFAEALAARMHRKRILRLHTKMMPFVRIGAKCSHSLRDKIAKLSTDMTFDNSRVQTLLPDFVPTDIVANLYNLAKDE